MCQVGRPAGEPSRLHRARTSSPSQHPASLIWVCAKREGKRDLHGKTVPWTGSITSVSSAALASSKVPSGRPNRMVSVLWRPVLPQWLLLMLLYGMRRKHINKSEKPPCQKKHA